ncbi:hypothetical protein BN1180_05080 [Peribacillus simplex]|uniref:Uncharacterized protein n=1 Tax=Peribacillus simplex TaxID=1478 RepID=A0AAN2PML6_9BACI|nr:hypothetical protein BN1180_05080 [Peribacillus simplex]
MFLSFLAGQLRTHSSYQEVFFRSNLIFSYYRNAAPLVKVILIKESRPLTEQLYYH